MSILVPLARSFTAASSQFLQCPQGVILNNPGTTPFSMGCWFLSDDSTILQTLMSINRSTSFERGYSLVIDGATAGDPVRVRYNNGSDNYRVTTTTGYTPGRWHHAICTVDANATVWLDGGGRNSSTGGAWSGDADRFCIGRSIASGVTRTPMSGKIIWPCIWNTVLTNAEVAALASGVNPLRIRPENILAFWDWTGRELEPSQGISPGLYSLTNSGTRPILEPTALKRTFFLPMSLGPGTVIYDETSTGGVTAGDSATITAEMTPASDGGMTAGDSAEVFADFSPTSDGGVTAGDSATVTAEMTPTSDGGILVGGSSTATKVPGLDIDLSQFFCPCNSETITNESSGGVTIGGEATVTAPELLFPVALSLGGSATVEILQDVYDGITAVYPLDETSDGSSGEFLDRTRNHLDGTGGAGDTSMIPSVADGIFCLPCQEFFGRQFIEFLPDDLTQDITISCWAKVNSFGVERALFSRVGNLALMHNIGNGVLAYDQSQWSYGTTLPSYGRWLHYAVTRNATELKVYLDGTLEDSQTITATTETPETNYAGRKDVAGFLTGLLQEVRIYPDVKDENWLTAEHDNLCSPGFFVVLNSEVAGIDI